MPQFKSQAATNAAANADAFIAGYIMALYWTSTGPDDEMDSEVEMSADALEAIIFDCDAFRKEAGDLLTEAINREGYSEERAGHDFWLTRNGHGAGYWDRDELSEGDLGDKLSEVARKAGVSDAYLGDDGKLHV